MIKLHLKKWWLDVKLSWLHFKLWWWTRGLEATDIKDEETLVRETLQSLNEVEIDEIFENRVRVMVSILIPPSSDHPLYDRYAYEFEKSMGMLVSKCLALSEKFKRNDLSVTAFTIQADLFVRDEDADILFENGRPDWLTKCLEEDDEDAETETRPHWLNACLHSMAKQGNPCSCSSCVPPKD